MLQAWVKEPNQTISFEQFSLYINGGEGIGTLSGCAHMAHSSEAFMIVFICLQS